MCIFLLKHLRVNISHLSIKDLAIFKSYVYFFITSIFSNCK